MIVSGLSHLGWNAFFEAQRSSNDRVFARVVEVQRGICRVAGDFDGWAEVSGRFRHETTAASDFPAVGDFVVLRVEGDQAVIERRLERRSTISRAAAGRATDEQVIAANVDTIFVVTSANEDLNPRRIERYLAMIWEAGATPVVVVNKIDLADDPEAIVATLRARLSFVDVVAVTALSGPGSDAASRVAAFHAVRAFRPAAAPAPEVVLVPYLAPAQTVALVGSSGVGKSTLVNRLVGHDVQKVSAIRESDGRGRHTTPARQLVALPGGALLIDTPGMRELQPWSGESAVDATFDDVLELTRRCRYEDCQHDTEPDCAVQAAIAAGTLDPDRLENYRHLLREAAFEARKRDKAAATEAKKRWKQMSNAQKALYRSRERLE